MYKSLRWVLVCIALLSFSSLACGVLGGGEEATAVPEASSAEDTEESVDVEQATATEVVDSPTDSPVEEAPTDAPPEPTAIPEEEESVPPPADEDKGESEEAPSAAGSQEIDLSGLTHDLDFDSYRFTISTDFESVDEAGNVLHQVIDGEFAYLAKPPSMQMMLHVEGIEDAQGFGDIAMAQIGDTSYVVIAGLGCVTTPATEGGLLGDDNPLLELIDPSTLIEDVKGAQRIGEETVNGVPTTVYEFDESFLEGEQSLNQATGTIYIAKEGNFMVRLVMDGEGSMNPVEDSADSVGKFHVEYELIDVNQPLEIGVPEGCDQEAEGGPDLPMLVDAADVVSFAGFTSYVSQESLEAAVTFYDDSLAALGWQRDSEASFVTAESALLYYGREDEAGTITIVVGEDTASGGISVTISTLEGG